MKAFILSLLIMSLPVLAKSELPTGLFQVDSSQSKITLFAENQDSSGFIDIKENFRDSTLKVESPDASFESTEIFGDAEEFKIKGNLTYKGETKLIILRGRSFAMSGKVALRLYDDSILIRVIAARPSARTMAIQKEVEQIIQ
ncbi:hypothetical protein [Peredibacter starrii]|uniref:Organic solvent tolerance-like N-terminal domain-containing protein n=1 Tax=Peredibacter starrii TaxID=28202 RepID=A0AAX4HTT1_9BACT|nr:hypothetical protein [Peredibacter starrii]WPU66483.1 hypothetical protein SOO65_06960 [Peredibacter starrii]